MGGEVRRYFDSVPAARKARLAMLHGLVLARFPDAVVDLHCKMPTYRHGEGWVAIANQKNYVSLYTCAAEHLAEFRQAHPGI